MPRPDYLAVSGHLAPYSKILPYLVGFIHGKSL